MDDFYKRTVTLPPEQFGYERAPDWDSSQMVAYRKAGCIFRCRKDGPIGFTFRQEDRGTIGFSAATTKVSG